jgi:hypothetical protein
MNQLDKQTQRYFNVIFAKNCEMKIINLEINMLETADWVIINDLQDFTTTVHSDRVISNLLKKM